MRIITRFPILACAAGVLWASAAGGDEPRPAGGAAGGEVVVTVRIKDHHFTPSEIHVPPRQRVRLEVTNEDAAAEEFDSHALQVEKVIPGGKSGSVRIRPLAPGRYPFVGEYHEDVARGVVIAE